MAGAVLYVRVSDARQVKGTSLDVQERVCRDWCEANGFDVVRVFIDRGESAKTDDRPQFQAMFRFLQQAKAGTILCVVVYKFDRFSRNEDGIVYRLRLRKQHIDLRSATEHTDNTPTGRYLQTVLSATAQLDNEVRAERTSMGMMSRLGTGQWMWRAPTGYLNGEDRNEPSLKPDPARGPLITKLFQLMASGEHTKASALAQVTALGLKSTTGRPLTQETIRKI